MTPPYPTLPELDENDFKQRIPIARRIKIENRTTGATTYYPSIRNCNKATRIPKSIISLANINIFINYLHHNNQLIISRY